MMSHTSMRCMAHKLELAILDAFKGESISTELKDLLHGIYKHYQCSPKALRELNELTQVLELSVLKPNVVACCGHGFSTLKCVKSDWRSRLGTETLDHLMRTSIDGPDLESYNAARTL